MKNELFKEYSDRLNILDENIRKLSVSYAREFHGLGQCSKEEALERGIAKAEMESRKL
ncbi:hypothetical protein [Euzebyella saccharophila]|uniref:Uncharacterized protein n=1 Tax=Euzebyella saccharophila TaxID=679664 RepID=A0ABV8K050_9FLAO|nr:hypothetical protein [Euzebyella saccharophila]